MLERGGRQKKGGNALYYLEPLLFVLANTRQFYLAEERGWCRQEWINRTEMLVLIVQGYILYHLNIHVGRTSTETLFG